MDDDFARFHFDKKKSKVPWSHLLRVSWKSWKRVGDSDSISVFKIMVNWIWMKKDPGPNEPCMHIYRFSKFNLCQWFFPQNILTKMLTHQLFAWHSKIKLKGRRTSLFPIVHRYIHMPIGRSYLLTTSIYAQPYNACSLSLSVLAVSTCLKRQRSVSPPPLNKMFSLPSLNFV